MESTDGAGLFGGSNEVDGGVGLGGWEGDSTRLGGSKNGYTIVVIIFALDGDSIGGW